MDKTLEAIRQKCIDANPEIKDREYVYKGIRGGLAISTINAPIRLADVLLAIAWHGKEYACGSGDNVAEFSFTGSEPPYWNLRDDNLEKQLPQTVDFIGSVLRT